MPAEGALRDGRDTGFHLIETMRWEPGSGVLRRDGHIARLTRSAAELGFAHDADAISERLMSLTSDTPLRLRMTLDRDGSVGLDRSAYAGIEKSTVWRVAIAGTRLRSDDPLLAHKTSRRDVYDAARAEFSRDDIDEVLLLNERGEVCEGTITNLFVETEDGLVTPPLACGLLRGVLREEMLGEIGRASWRDRVLVVV